MNYNFELMNQYFNQTSDRTTSMPTTPASKYIPTIALIAGGIIAILGSMIASSNRSYILFMGIAAIIAGAAFPFLEKKQIKSYNDQIISDSQYDAELFNFLEFLQTQAPNKLGIDENEAIEMEPIIFKGYIYSTNALKLKKGEDGLWRSNKYEFVKLFFSQNAIHCYTYRFYTTQNKYQEETNVIFYRDIISVSTISDSVTTQWQRFDYENLKITTSGGTMLQIALRDVQNSQSSVNAIRSLLRTKKQS